MILPSKINNLNKAFNFNSFLLKYESKILFETKKFFWIFSLPYFLAAQIRTVNNLI